MTAQVVRCCAFFHLRKVEIDLLKSSENVRYVDVEVPVPQYRQVPREVPVPAQVHVQVPRHIQVPRYVDVRWVLFPT